MLVVSVGAMYYVNGSPHNDISTSMCLHVFHKEKLHLLYFNILHLLRVN